MLILFISITQVLSSDPESPSTVDQADSVVVEYNDFIKVYGIWDYKGSCNYSPSNANRINYKICIICSAEHLVNRKTNQLWKKSCIELPKYLIFIRVKLKSPAKFWVFLKWFLNFKIFDFVPSFSSRTNSFFKLFQFDIHKVINWRAKANVADTVTSVFFFFVSLWMAVNSWCKLIQKK